MIVVDVESSGMIPNHHSLISIGAVDFDDPARIFYGECRIFPGARVDRESLAISGFTEAQITDPLKQTDQALLENFLRFAAGAKEKTLAGQNPSFDRDFLMATAYRYHLPWDFAYRTVDLHSVCYFQMIKSGVAVPTERNHSALNLDRILEYLGLPKRKGRHHALTDAKLAAECFSRLFYGKTIFSSF
jgi:DNA polymerase III epsilon subunit-like protein